MPALSPQSWQAAHAAAMRAIPVLVAKGLHEAAALLARRARQFAARAA